MLCHHLSTIDYIFHHFSTIDNSCYHLSTTGDICNHLQSFVTVALASFNCVAVLRWHFAWFLAISQSWYHGTRNEDKLGQVSAMVYLADKINIKNVFHVTSAQIHFQMTLIWKSMEETALERFKLKNFYKWLVYNVIFNWQLFKKNIEGTILERFKFIIGKTKSKTLISIQDFPQYNQPLK